MNYIPANQTFLRQLTNRPNRHRKGLGMEERFDYDGLLEVNSDLRKQLADAQATVEALQRERDELREMTKVICGHCCEPMAIPSKAVLQSQLSALQGLVETIKCELFDRYDGAPDSPTRWMGSLIRDIEIAQEFSLLL